MKNGTLLIAVILTIGALALWGCSIPKHDHSSHDHGSDNHSSHHHDEAGTEGKDPGLDLAGRENSGAVAIGAKPYPLDTYIVSEEKLDSMGKPIELVYKGQQIKLCCTGCVDDFRDDPEGFLSKLSKQVSRRVCRDEGERLRG